MNRGKTHKEGSSRPFIPQWMTTWCDFSSVLVAFFLMLVGFSTTEKENYGKMRGSLAGYIGIPSIPNRDSFVDRRMLASGGISFDGYENAPENEPLAHLGWELQGRVREVDAAHALQCHVTREGMEILLMPGAVFAPDGADILPDKRHLLDTIVTATQHLPNRIEVSAMPVPDFEATPRFRAARDLRLARAHAVCNYLALAGISRERLAMAVDAARRDEAPTDASARLADVKIILLRLPKGKSDY